MGLFHREKFGYVTYITSIYLLSSYHCRRRVGVYSQNIFLALFPIKKSTNFLHNLFHIFSRFFKEDKMQTKKMQFLLYLKSITSTVLFIYFNFFLAGQGLLSTGNGSRGGE